MKIKNLKSLIILIVIAVLFASCQKESPIVADELLAGKISEEKMSLAPVKVFATGLNNPRGLKFGPDCHLYVAEAGLGGTENYDSQCPELVPPDDAPYFGSPTGGRISKISPDGVRTTVTNKLPTVISNFGDIYGPSDVAFIGSTLYALLRAGCGHGVPTVPTSIVKINSSESFTVIADLGKWRVTHPVANPDPADADPEGVWQSMISVCNDLYALDANHGELVKVTTSGNITRVVDVSAKYGHIVPTALDYYQGNIYMGNLGDFPIVNRSTNVYKISPNNGHIKIVEDGFTAIIGLVFDKKGRMYVLEMSRGNDYPTPGTGRVVRVNCDGSREVIAKGLSNPTGITLGPDENLYILNWGFGGAKGDGEVLKVKLNS